MNVVFLVVWLVLFVANSIWFARSLKKDYQESKQVVSLLWVTLVVFSAAEAIERIVKIAGN